MSDHLHPFFSNREYRDFEEYIVGQPTAPFPDQARFLGMLVGRDFTVVGADDFSFIEAYAGMELTAFEAAYVLTGLPFDPSFADDARKLTFGMLLEGVSDGQVTTQEYMSQGMNTDALRVVNALGELKILFEELYPDPVAAHYGLELFAIAIEETTASA